MKIFITVLPVSNNLISNTEDILKLNSKPRVDKNVITAILDGRKYFWRVSPNGFWEKWIDNHKWTTYTAWWLWPKIYYFFYKFQINSKDHYFYICVIETWQLCVQLPWHLYHQYIASYTYSSAFVIVLILYLDNNNFDIYFLSKILAFCLGEFWTDLLCLWLNFFFTKKITKNAQAGLMIFWLGRVKILYYKKLRSVYSLNNALRISIQNLQLSVLHCCFDFPSIVLN